MNCYVTTLYVISQTHSTFIFNTITNKNTTMSIYAATKKDDSSLRNNSSILFLIVSFFRCVDISTLTILKHNKPKKQK